MWASPPLGRVPKLIVFACLCVDPPISPDGQFMVCGTSPLRERDRIKSSAKATAPEDADPGEDSKSLLCFFDLSANSSTKQVVSKVSSTGSAATSGKPLGPGPVTEFLDACIRIAVADRASAISVRWHKRTNQIFVRSVGRKECSGEGFRSCSGQYPFSRILSLLAPCAAPRPGTPACTSTRDCPSAALCSQRAEHPSGPRTPLTTLWWGRSISRTPFRCTGCVRSAA